MRSGDYFSVYANTLSSAAPQKYSDERCSSEPVLITHYGNLLAASCADSSLVASGEPAVSMTHRIPPLRSAYNWLLVGRRSLARPGQATDPNPRSYTHYDPSSHCTHRRSQRAASRRICRRDSRRLARCSSAGSRPASGAAPAPQCPPSWEVCPSRTTNLPEARRCLGRTTSVTGFTCGHSRAFLL